MTEKTNQISDYQNHKQELYSQPSLNVTENKFKKFILPIILIIIFILILVVILNQIYFANKKTIHLDEQAIQINPINPTYTPMAQDAIQPAGSTYFYYEQAKILEIDQNVIKIGFVGGETKVFTINQDTDLLIRTEEKGPWQQTSLEQAQPQVGETVRVMEDTNPVKYQYAIVISKY